MPQLVLNALKDIFPILWNKSPKATIIGCILVLLTVLFDVGGIQQYARDIVRDRPVQMDKQLTEWGKDFLDQEGLVILHNKECDRFRTIRYIEFASRFGPFLDENFAASKQYFVYTSIQGKCYKIINDYVKE